MKTGVYLIRNTVNGKVYVGSTSISLDQRWVIHRKELRGGYHANRHLQSAWNKYGESAFVFEIVERVDPDDCLKAEQRWIDSLKSSDDKHGYNICPTAGSSRGRPYNAARCARMALAKSGKKASEETKAKMSASRRARWTPEYRASYVGPNKGKRHSPETLAKMRLAQQRPEVKAAALKGIIGRPMSATCKAALAKRNKEPKPESQRQKIAASLRGRKQDDAVKANRRATMGTPEFRARMSEIKRQQAAKKREDVLATETAA